MTGFVAGSLAVIWPWKTKIIEIIEFGEKTKEVVKGYQWRVPETDTYLLFALLLMTAGATLVPLLERIAHGKPQPDGE